MYGLRYSDFVVPLVKAVQELSSQNDQLKSQNEAQQKINTELQKQVDELKAMIVSGNQNNAASTNNIQLQASNPSASLEQNAPNPFTNTTTIHYTLPQTYSSAQVVITDKNGKVLKQVNLSGIGEGSLKVDASALSSGAYNYTLYIDGKLSGSKQMEHLK